MNKTVRSCAAFTKAIFVLNVIFALVALSGCTSSPSGTSSGGTIFNSGNMAPGASFTHVFAAAGVFPYHCSIHGAAGGVGMAGTITVVAGASSGIDTIMMTAAAFSPAAVTITAGETVMWINSSAIAHTVLSDN